ncbi:MAG TPA: aspartate aminotransferase family protein [Candidatus Limnocylindrales bacterium]|nr:aspartate aminotransferase family protein [Candidatus Limnocylindrales bacterium]
MDSKAVFPRNFLKTYPQATRAEGCFIYTAEGRRYLDAAGGAAVVTIGHGVESVARAMAEQAARLAYVHSSQFQTAPAEKLAQRILALAPHGMRRGGRVYFTSGGSEATETAIKLARQYWLERGNAKRTRVIARRQSYHGSTLGALSLSGNVRRREPFAPLLAEWGHVAPCYCYRCPFDLRYPECNVDCADDLDRQLARDGSDDVAAFILEPVSGATLGAVVPPDGYLQRIAEICRRNKILLIADEIMTGMGRTGKAFAVEHWGVVPDMILVGKGVASGYAPLGAVIVAGQVADAISQGSGTFLHGFTYNSHPVSVAAGNAVLDFAEREKLFARVEPAGKELAAALEPLKRFSVVGDVRGIGLLQAIEFVRDSKTREPFPADANIASRIAADVLEAGVATYPMQGCVDGNRGDHVLLAPPFTITSAMIQMLASALEHSIGDFEKAHMASTGGSPARA